MKITRWRPRVRSKNHSCEEIRHMNNGLGFFPFRSVVRLGSKAPLKRVFPKSYAKAVEVNTVEAVENSRSKLLMKKAFAKADISQITWWDSIDDLMTEELEEIPFPIIVKRIYGYKGKGMTKIDSKEQLETWLENHPNTEGWYFEQFYNYAREYRLHCTQEKCFYAARKMIKSDTPEDKRWFRNDSNCIWVTEYTVEREDDQITGYDETTSNELFDKPVNWDKIEEDCVKALKSIGLDVGAFDVKVQSAVDTEGNLRQDPKYILIEVNSAPSFGVITTMKYKEILPEVLKNKHETLL